MNSEVNAMHAGSNPSQVNLNMVFKGNEKNSVRLAQQFLFKLDMAFKLQESMGKDVSELFKVATAMLNLDGSALAWFTNRYGNSELPLWHQFVEEFTLEFCPTDEFELRQVAAKYNGCHQGKNSVEQFIQEFEGYRTLLPGEYENEWATRDRFVQGLRAEIRGRVFQHRPNSLAEAKFLARDFEKDSAPRARDFRFSHQDRWRGEPMEIDSIKNKNYRGRNFDSYKRNKNYNRNYNGGYAVRNQKVVGSDIAINPPTIENANLQLKNEIQHSTKFDKYILNNKDIENLISVSKAFTIG
ncbi:hypothetical protein BOH78_5346 [Pichia kudriavzevii]|uniref:Ty3 transposon capsid-like protein domain-containing protein n=1 Tax=Pichia kudriavzevii TaxID=4909 RepID=A0A1V2LF86_PICKU|nr:hypothetical protein BOH78_5346 [Pichia kudriavzevii]